MDRNYLLWKLLSFVPLLLSLTVHEWAHAYTAFRLGDDTAEREGRLTLDPISHIDLLGTLILPIFSPFGFGWAKPVPVNPARFRRDVTMRTGMMITAMAGPISNLLIALSSTVALGMFLRFHVIRGMDDGPGKLLEIAIGMNLALCLFNFLPIPPLDGSRVVDGLLPYRYRHAWEQVERLSPVGMLVAFAAGGYLLATPIAYAQGILFRVVYFVAGW